MVPIFKKLPQSKNFFSTLTTPKALVPLTGSYSFNFSFSTLFLSKPIYSRFPVPTHPMLKKTFLSDLTFPSIYLSLFLLPLSYQLPGKSNVLSVFTSSTPATPEFSVAGLLPLPFALTVDSNGSSHLEPNFRPQPISAARLPDCLPGTGPSCLSLLANCLCHWLLFLHSPFTTNLSL